MMSINMCWLGLDSLNRILEGQRVANENTFGIRSVIIIIVIINISITSVFESIGSFNLSSVKMLMNDDIDEVCFFWNGGREILLIFFPRKSPLNQNC